MYGIEDATDIFPPLLAQSKRYFSPPKLSLYDKCFFFCADVVFCFFFWFVLSESESEEKRCVWIRCGQVSKERVIVQVSWSIEGSGDFGA